MLVKRVLFLLNVALNIYEKRTVRRVGCLQELNRDARSSEHEKGRNSVVTVEKLLRGSVRK